MIAVGSVSLLLLAAAASCVLGGCTATQEQDACAAWQNDGAPIASAIETAAGVVGQDPALTLEAGGVGAAAVIVADEATATCKALTAGTLPATAENAQHVLDQVTAVKKLAGNPAG